MSFTYEYDAANQLIRENLYCGSGNSNNATYSYTYDQWGNILNKKKYAYTTGNLGSVQNTVNYAFGNSTWKDQLTSYNGQSISYDNMGNPISYLGAALSWNGKQLTGYSKGGTNVTYAYNEDGLRTQKTHNGTTTNYYYNGSVLIGMQSGNTVQRFSYDAQGKVVAVDYSTNGGSSYTTYYYLRNAQGDIVKLIDGSRNTVVEYTYDSWGKLIAVTGSHASTIGQNQPFRYRGYVYDGETQWYYLQSRYYDPNTCRFISSDVILSTGRGVLGHNSYAYCDNNPIVRADTQGRFWETVFDVVSLIFSAAEVVTNPADPWAWAGLAGDIVDLVPFVTGVGETTKVVGATVRVANKADDVIDTIHIVKAVDFTDDALDKIRTLDKVGDATKSTADAGRRIHQGYKTGQNVGELIRKEATKGKNRIDFFDDVAKVIYELKPNNPRGIRSGVRQLQRYNKALGGGYTLMLELY